MPAHVFSTAESIVQVAHGYNMIHCIRNETVCAACAREAQAQGAVVHGSAFEEGDDVECERCGVMIESTYGPCDDNDAI